jgi:HAD superfamily hydrolase (TIGR01509 family)
VAETAGTKGSLITIQGLAFDLEGTIIDLEALHRAAHLKVAADVDVRLSMEEAIERLPHLIGGPDEEVAAEIAALSGQTESIERALSLKRAYFMQLLQLQDIIAPRQGFREFLNWVRKLGLKIAIGTVTARDFALHLLKRAGIFQEVGEQFIVTREDVREPKPSPEVYIKTARCMGIETHAQLVFEDSAIGVRAARSAGSKVIVLPTVTSRSFLDGLIFAGAEAVFTTWYDPGLRSLITSDIKAQQVIKADS